MSSKRMLTVVVSGLLFIAVIIVISILYSRATQNIPSVELPEITTSDDGASSSGNGNGNESDGQTRIDITTDNVQAVIATLVLTKPENYSRSLVVENYWQDGSSKYEIDTSVLNGISRFDIKNEGMTKHIIISEDSLYIWYDDNTAYYEGDIPADSDGAWLTDEYQMIPTYEDVLALSKDEIINAGYINYEAVSCIFVESASETLGYTNKYFISVVLGLLIAAESYDGNTLIYKMTAGDCNCSAPDENLFTLPDGVDLVKSS